MYFFLYISILPPSNFVNNDVFKSFVFTFSIFDCCNNDADCGNNDADCDNDNNDDFDCGNDADVDCGNNDADLSLSINFK